MFGPANSLSYTATRSVVLVSRRRRQLGMGAAAHILATTETYINTGGDEMAPNNFLSFPSHLRLQLHGIRSLCTLRRRICMVIVADFPSLCDDIVGGSHTRST